MPGTGPLPGPSLGGVDFISYDCGGNGIWYTIWDHSWVSSVDIVKFGDLDTIVHETPDPGGPPHSGAHWAATPVVMGIPAPFTGPVDAASLLPSGVPFQWVFLFRNVFPTSTLFNMASMGRDSYPRWSAPVYPLQSSGLDLINTQHMVDPNRACVELLTGQFTYNFSPQYVCVDILNWLNDDIVMDSIPLQIEWFLKFTIPDASGPPPPIVVPPNVPPVISPTNPPTGIVNPTAVPPSVSLRQTIEKANPGFTCDITRHELYKDLVQVYVGQKVRLTAESYGMYLGFVNRAHVITQARFKWKAHGGEKPFKEFSSQFRLEKIPGTLLPGAGTSNAAQDAAGTGAEISMYHRLNIDGTGLNLGRLG